jgi:adenine-specific DNA-methyltransferase
MDDFNKLSRFSAPYNAIVNSGDDNCFMLMPTKEEDIQVLDFVNNWNENLISLGYKLKTGRLWISGQLSF